MEGQRKARAALADEREKHQAETEAASLVYVAEMLGTGTGSERLSGD